MKHSSKFSKSSKHKWLAPSLVLAALVLLASWMGTAGGGYFVGQWTMAALLLAALALIASVFGVVPGAGSRWAPRSASSPPIRSGRSPRSFGRRTGRTSECING
jgi:hypothetical protein